MRIYRAFAAMLLGAGLLGGCSDPLGWNAGGPVEQYNICIGDLRLLIPREEAEGFDVSWSSLLRERKAKITATSFGTDPTVDFAVSASDGTKLPGLFFLISQEMRDSNAEPHTQPVRRTGEPDVEFLGRQVHLHVSPRPSPAPGNKGHLIAGSARVSDRVSLMIRFKSNETPLSQAPAFLKGVEDLLVRWSSGQVLSEPDGVPQCPAPEARKE